MTQAVSRFERILAPALAVGFALTLALVLPGDAAAKPAKSTENEAKFISFDAENETVTVKITKKGRGPNKKQFKRGQEVTFNVKPGGSVLTRTTVKINGQKAELTDLPKDKTILLRWVPDKNKDGEFFIRGIDSILSEEELDERFGTE